MAEIIRITSEALQATVRRLLPSQQGFGDDLQATNLITPIIDLTPTAEGSQLPSYLANAASFTDGSGITDVNTTTTIANTPGFYHYNISCVTVGSASAVLEMVNGLGVKILDGLSGNGTGVGTVSLRSSGVVFLDTGDSLRSRSNSANATVLGYIRQVADRYGNINNPSGFTFE